MERKRELNLKLGLWFTTDLVFQVKHRSNSTQIDDFEIPNAPIA